MTLVEELVGIVVRIQNLKARIDSAEDKSITWLEELELNELRSRLERMQNAVDGNKSRRRVKRCVF